MRKLISWFGFGNSNRAGTLCLGLTFLQAARLIGHSLSQPLSNSSLSQQARETTFTDTSPVSHFLPSTVLCYSVRIRSSHRAHPSSSLDNGSLAVSGYQADEEGLLHECGVVLDRIIDRFPDGTLWVLNRTLPSPTLHDHTRARNQLTPLHTPAGAKLARYRHDTPQAIKILEDALTKGSTFREADSLLCFELSWCLLSAWELEKAADRFEQMCLLNNWSHATYVSIALGECLSSLSSCFAIGVK